MTHYMQCKLTINFSTPLIPFVTYMLLLTNKMLNIN
jgi:hypothetical protein